MQEKDAAQPVVDIEGRQKTVLRRPRPRFAGRDREILRAAVRVRTSLRFLREIIVPPRLYDPADRLALIRRRIETSRAADEIREIARDREHAQPVVSAVADPILRDAFREPALLVRFRGRESQPGGARRATLDHILVERAREHAHRLEQLVAIEHRLDVLADRLVTRQLDQRLGCVLDEIILLRLITPERRRLRRGIDID